MLLVGRKSQYLCTNRIKPIPPISAFGHSLFVRLTTACGSGVLQTPILVAVRFCLPILVQLCLPILVRLGLLVLGFLGVRG